MNTQERYQDVCRLTDLALQLDPVKEFMEAGIISGPLNAEQLCVMNLINALSDMRVFYRRDQ